MDKTFSLVIQEFKDFDGPLEIMYEKRADGLWPSVCFANASFFFSRCASTFEVRSPENFRDIILDAYSVAIVPAKIEIQLFGCSAISDGVFLSAKPSLIQAVKGQYGIDFDERMKSVPSLVALPRTNWLNEIMHRYVYERVTAGRPDGLACRFLEQEIVKEVYFRFDEYSDRGRSRFDLDSKAIDLRSPMLRAAMAFIDANLFRDISVQDITRKVGASESTLLREFKSNLGKGPTAYIAERRLEEAMILIKSQRYSVGQVSDIVGYENVSAFSAAFKKQFGLTPSQVIAKIITVP